MVAKISTGQSIRGMLHYNENKVNGGEAKLILSSGFAAEVSTMNIQQKLQRFQHLTELKPNVKTNAIHISLNFHSTEKLDNFKLQQIAIAYMEGIGFSDQPFLVYRHDDAAHQHLHITTTNITAEGKRIDLHDIGRILSEPARKEIEIQYGLVKAESKTAKQEASIKPAEFEKARYGRLPTKRAISNVVAAVFREYKFTSLAEYNAVLKCFNVVAFRGAEHTAMFEKKGLMYSLQDKNGIQVGVPIKSSAFYCKATMRNLEKKFERNVEKRKSGREDLKKRIDQVFAGEGSVSRSGFKGAAKAQGIQVAFRENEQGMVYGITFIDHRNKTVFNGSDLGKNYSAKAVTERFVTKDLKFKSEQKAEIMPARSSKQAQPRSAEMPFKTKNKVKVLDIVLEKSYEDGSIRIPKRKRKRRKKQVIIQQNNL